MAAKTEAEVYWPGIVGEGDVAGRTKKSWEMCACAETGPAAQGLRLRVGDLGEADVNERGERGPEMVECLCLRSEHRLTMNGLGRIERAYS